MSTGHLPFRPLIGWTSSLTKHSRFQFADAHASLFRFDIFFLFTISYRPVFKRTLVKFRGDNITLNLLGRFWVLQRKVSFKSPLGICRFLGRHQNVQFDLFKIIFRLQTGDVWTSPKQGLADS